MRRVILWIVVVVGLLVGAWGVVVHPFRRHTRAAAPPDSESTGYRAVRLFFVAPSGDRLVSESRELPESATLHERVAALVSELDRGPTGPGVAALPPGTSLLHVFLDDEGMMTVDVSRAFQQGFRGGSGAEYLAVSSLARTLAANVPDVKRVLIVCGGEPLATLGGHFPLDRPLDVVVMP